MRTAQFVLSAVALVLATGSVAVLARVSHIPGLEWSAAEATVAVLPPLWCLFAGWLARAAGWRMRLSLLLIASFVLLLALGLFATCVEEGRWTRAVGRRPTYIIHLEIGFALTPLIPLGLLSLLLGGVCRWREWRGTRERGLRG